MPETGLEAGAGVAISRYAPPQAATAAFHRTLAMMRSGNPALKESTFLDLGSGTLVQGDAGAMTLNGTVNKTAMLLVLTLAGALFTWSQFSAALAAGNPGAVMPYVWGGAIGGFIVALVTVFKKQWSPFTAPLYAVLEGLFLGAVSAMFELRFPGIVIQAVGLTFGTLAALLLAYRSGLIKATENFKLGVVAATGGIALLYLVQIGLQLFGFKGMGFIHDSSLLGIAFSGFVVVIAALNLVLDFDFIEHGVEQGAPKYMEWYAAFGLLVTLVWLYLEILRLLSKLQSRN
ncbi:Bax inhibitor-1/YccA family protein [Thermomonas aquatica]|uniref:Bax inhibitor-1/YccA family protein n=2 Tax=Thermomonas aquatica TaxID=2202149 RepID=A0A5B7ZPE6_9GAMM|nr:Bax inhibitor-1/YccA family protein [Thermomonas aquatica]